MMNISEDALICDLAETYQIFDYRSLPVQLIATLSVGLRNNSRIKLLAADMPVSQETLILATIADRIELLRYGLSDTKGKDKPTLLVDAIMGESNKSKVVGFATPHEFEKTLARIRGQ